MRRSTLATLAILVLLVLGAVVVVSLNTNNKSDTTTPSPSPSPSTGNPPSEQPSPTPPPASTDQTSVGGTIYIKDMKFTPSQISVQKGSQVTWTNNDDVAHTVTIDHGEGPTSGNVEPGSSYSYTFNTAGSFQYHCNIHPSMRGTIVVR